MNRYFKILLGAGLACSLAACNQKAEYTTYSFVSFDATSLSVDEDAGILEIPVYAYTKDGDLAFPRGESANTTVTFEVVDGTAKNGVDFTVEPANGVLTFDGSSAGAIKVNVVNHEGVHTGNLDFSVRITGASDGYTLGGAREASVRINDLDPDPSGGTVEDIYGTYTATAEFDGDPLSWTLNISPVGTDPYVIKVDVMVPLFEGYEGNGDVEGVVSDDLSTITFHLPQESLLYPEDPDDPFVFVEYVGDFKVNTGEADVVFTQESAGVFTSEQGIVAVPLEAMALYVGGGFDPGTITLTKQ